jgi:hypothetical protein
VNVLKRRKILYKTGAVFVGPSLLESVKEKEEQDEMSFAFRDIVKHHRTVQGKFAF